MSLARSLVLSALALAALAGCPTGEVCTDIAVASVTVRLQDAAGVDLSDADVSFSTDGGGTFTPCDDAIVGQWVCGWELAGAITVRAEAVGYVTAEETVTVEADSCHVLGEDLELTLEEAPVAGQWEEARAYYVQLIADQDECDDSWALYSMNCYQMAWFCPDGAVTIVVTDIANHATYALDGRALNLEFTSPGDLPASFDFEWQDDDTLVDTLYGQTWERDADFSVIGAPYCDAGSEDPPTVQ